MCVCFTGLYSRPCYWNYRVYIEIVKLIEEIVTVVCNCKCQAFDWELNVSRRKGVILRHGWVQFKLILNSSTKHNNGHTCKLWAATMQTKTAENSRASRNAIKSVIFNGFPTINHKNETLHTKNVPRNRFELECNGKVSRMKAG